MNSKTKAFFTKKPQFKDKCNYCKNLEATRDYTVDKINTIDRFLTNTKMPLSTEYRNKLSEDASISSMALFGLDERIKSCDFPNCKSCKRSDDNE